MESHPDAYSTSIVSYDEPIDIISMAPFELSHKIFSHVGDYKNAVLVCRRWKNLVDDGIACSVLLSREKMALIELEPLGVRSLDVTRLICRRKGLESIPDSVGALTNLEWLDLSGNAVEVIPISVGTLANLEHLYLYGNALVTIPETVGALTNLRLLLLFDNQLESIPDTIGALTNLRRLMVHEN